MYYPHWTPVQGWKWSEGVTTHANFNEDIVFGDESNSLERQNKTRYWSNHNSIFSESSSHPAYLSYGAQTTTPHQDTPDDQRENPPPTPNHTIINIQPEEI
ncbi:hypothetical protein K3495_g12214 [Podosphaera aphanis]|nr:hypothetical protein K3495_g12214 [Podosphaera aphanis]